MGQYNLTRRVLTLERLYSLSPLIFNKPDFQKMSDNELFGYIREFLKTFDSKESLNVDLNNFLGNETLRPEHEQLIKHILSDPNYFDRWHTWT